MSINLNVCWIVILTSNCDHWNLDFSSFDY